MSPSRTDAIQFLKSSIAGYRYQLKTLQRRAPDSGNVVELSHARGERERLTALIDDANQLLTQLRAV